MPLTAHHLVPRSEHKRRQVRARFPDKADRERTVDICPDCHGTIHRFFSNQELADAYFTEARLLADEKFGKHIAWLRKQRNRRLKTRG